MPTTTILTCSKPTIRKYLRIPICQFLFLDQEDSRLATMERLQGLLLRVATKADMDL